MPDFEIMADGGIIALRDIPRGEPLHFNESQARYIARLPFSGGWLLGPPFWEPTFKWKATSGGCKKGEPVVLMSFEVYEDE